MAKNTGKEFENLTHEVFAALSATRSDVKVERNVFLPSQLTGDPRQIDVLLRSEVACLSMLTIIECRDYKKKLNVTYVDGLHSKLLEVAAHKAVFVTRRGFTKGAMRKAERLKITLCTPHQSSEDFAKRAGSGNLDSVISGISA